jgi:ubiquinone/menaquinone biosynthesis C-methylase UbiE
VVLEQDVVVDEWATWLSHGRDADDRATTLHTAAVLGAIRDRLLDEAAVGPGHVVLDAGCGEGLIGFGALGRTAPDGVVIFADTSPELLAICREKAERLAVADRCRFVEASAESMPGITDGSVDVVATRSVIAHVRDKQSAFSEFFRVLRSGGRLSSFDPIRRFAVALPGLGDAFWGYNTEPVATEATKLLALYADLQTPATDPSVAFGPEDLFDMAVSAGFEMVRTDVTTQHMRRVPMDWDVFSRRIAVPWLPSLRSAMEQVLTVEEQERFSAHLQSKVERGDGVWLDCVMFLAAMKSRASAGP